ncbi:hypothetical protein KDD17_11770 [Sulfitobacter albidus]|uniref:Uncharacterized protein n=1 Tax=Sulfitobacter albidus TaxID=2829501 RepID=A0A975PLC4_9RHOB|nr:hypothetical protein [Sulfitobacter albidus]QUJ75632.1 hypothetical protein KDD17_11770 [Sulfitobacter albidus]
MPQIIRPATHEDIAQMSALLEDAARARAAGDPALWRLSPDLRAEISDAVHAALTRPDQPFRQFWLVAEQSGRLTGVIHAMLLPVPPIYAGPQGDPGLILPDHAVADDAAPGTHAALLAAAESALRAAGAQILLTSFVRGDDWRAAFVAAGYDPLTLYLSREGPQGDAQAARPATAQDIPGIVARSAENREILFEIDPFWAIHPEADARFGAWMQRSLTLTDRDMLVHGPAADVEGYLIAQPASRLHFPVGHDISAVGVIDDFYHRDLAAGGTGAAALLQAGEAAFAARGTQAVFVVCPAGWAAKIALLEQAGYATAMVWSIKRMG